MTEYKGHRDYPMWPRKVELLENAGLKSEIAIELAGTHPLGRVAIGLLVFGAGQIEQALREDWTYEDRRKNG